MSTRIKTIYSNIPSLEGIIDEIVTTIERLDFDWCKEPVDVYISPADNEGRTTTFRFDILVENEDGYFGFSLL